MSGIILERRINQDWIPNNSILQGALVSCFVHWEKVNPIMFWNESRTKISCLKRLLRCTYVSLFHGLSMTSYLLFEDAHIDRKLCFVFITFSQNQRKEEEHNSMVVIELISNSTSIIILLFISKIKKRSACCFLHWPWRARKKKKKLNEKWSSLTDARKTV